MSAGVVCVAGSAGASEVPWFSDEEIQKTIKDLNDAGRALKESVSAAVELMRKYNHGSAGVA